MNTLEKGTDHNGTDYESIDQMWEKEQFDNEDGKLKWYSDSLNYWRKQQATIDGMLGGLGYLNNLDTSSSRRFIKALQTQHSMPANKALDCGAGIGRVSSQVLLKHFKRVDLVEPNPEFIAKAQTYLTPDVVDHFYNCGLQEFEPLDGFKYDCIWIQWVIIYLQDDDFVKFLKKAAACLSSPNSFICIKDNVTRSGFALDREDSSVTRSESLLLEIFEKAGLELVLKVQQESFPKELFPVMMYALKKREE